MAIQLAYADQFGRTNAQAYARVVHGEWDLGSGGFQITYKIYANKAAAEAGAKELSSATIFVPFDSSSMTGSIEQYLMAHDAVLSAGTPTQVT